MIDGIAADDPLNIIANESLRAESEQETKQGEFQSRDQVNEDRERLEKAREKATEFIAGLSWAVEKGLNIKQSSVVVADEAWKEGIEKFTPVFLKYDLDIKPQWVIDYIDPIKADLKAGAWCAGLGRGIYCLYQDELKMKAEAEKKDENNTDQVTD